MQTILLPIATASEAREAASRVVERYRGADVHVLLLNVQHPLPRHVTRFFAPSAVRAFHQDAGMEILAPAVAVLDAAGVTHAEEVRVGHAAKTIVGIAEAEHCADVVLGEPAHGLASLLRAGSVDSQVRHLMRVRTA